MRFAEAFAGFEFACRHKAFEFKTEVYFDAIILETFDRNFHIGAFAIDFGKVVPRVGFDLLVTQRNPALVFVDIEDYDIELLAFFDVFGRVTDFLRPRQVRNMNQAVDAGFDFHEYTEVGDVANRTTQDRAGGVTCSDTIPRIGLELFHTQ